MGPGSQRFDLDRRSGGAPTLGCGEGLWESDFPIAKVEGGNSFRVGPFGASDRIILVRRM
jgi:hypothetical protein